MSRVTGDAVVFQDHESGDLMTLSFIPEDTDDVLVAREVLERMVAEINTFRRFLHTLAVPK